MPDLRRLAAVLAAALLLGSCTSEGDDAPDGNDRAACDTSKGTLIVGVIAPLSGELGEQGKGIANATSLAVDQANESCAVDGYRLVAQPEDDGMNPDLGAQAATKLASTENLAGVVSTLNSSVSARVQPILDSAGILQVSPANTADSLSRGENFRTDPKRRFETYFRTCTVDSLQGPFAANYLVEKLEETRIAIVTDGLKYGEGLADSFTERAEEKGATIVTRQRIDGNATDFTKVIDALKPFEPDAVYFGGQFPQAAPLSEQLAAAGLTGPVMGGDGIYHDAYLSAGGKEGDLATSVGAPTEDLESAQEFASAYEAKGYPEGIGAYGAFAYDAANVIIDSLATTIGDGEWSPSMREDLVATVGEYEGDGATGKVAFDEYGDSTNHVLTVYEVRDGKWVAVETGEYID
ncbi:branched-chain amino acid ABC transporter substrate-binding protein [Actinophytocola gossypii]|uniref:Branched-chain amino acid ABC transporter substrate-binding protein n=1 Tax=Actinophytocola gossypii TaxID=2812003 RepID=A0ABT2JGY1_9PSEU|nr:branched-chain amino acid ABC transporter substrate-binding protein [Actinophytocola gossypii]MCT2587136.1 branched-chain amino acid ABC transporter substrate-binding protein [Actinophytocola gossypii]